MGLKKQLKKLIKYVFRTNYIEVEIPENYFVERVQNAHDLLIIKLKKK